MAPAPFLIHLNLAEIVELNEVIEHGRSGIIRKGAVFNKDPKRPERVLSLIRRHLAPLKQVSMELGLGAKSDRYLVARFAWGVDPDIGGVSAPGISRSKMGSFNKMGEDQGSRVTAYMFEGVVGRWIVDYLGGTAVNVDNLFAWTCTHELGHNLGLRHHDSPRNIMYSISGRKKEAVVKFLWSVSKGHVAFDAKQIKTMQELLGRP